MRTFYVISDCKVIDDGTATQLCAVRWIGKVNWNVVPDSGLETARKRPPCDSMIDRLIGSPMPVP
jgi:hypothetical protein